MPTAPDIWLLLDRDPLFALLGVTRVRGLDRRPRQMPSLRMARAPLMPSRYSSSAIH